MNIDLNPETYEPYTGYDYPGTNDELAQELGWESLEDGLDAIAERFGYASFWDLDQYIGEEGGLEAIDDIVAQLSPAEHIIWCVNA